MNKEIKVRKMEQNEIFYRKTVGYSIFSKKLKKYASPKYGKEHLHFSDSGEIWYTLTFDEANHILHNPAGASAGVSTEKEPYHTFKVDDCMIVKFEKTIELTYPKRTKVLEGEND